MKIPNHRRKGQAGFTLIELLVVVLIIGILASIAIPQYFKVVERSRLAEAQTMASQLRQAQERYMVRNGVYDNDTADTDLTNMDISFSAGGPAYGMKNYILSVADDSTASQPSYTLTFTRCTAPSTPTGCSASAAGVSSRYNSGYTMTYDRGTDVYSFDSGCPNCTTDFAQ